MSLAGIVLGILNVAIILAVLLLIGAIILWIAGWMGFPIPANVQKGYVLVCGLIGLYMIVALLFGIPTLRIVGGG